MENRERRNYVVNEILLATLRLFYQKDWGSISISEIIKEAWVSRNSFYRNFKSREDILKMHLRDLSEEWFSYVFNESELSFAEKLKALFSHCERNKEFYQRLYEQNLLYLFKDIMTDAMSPSPECSAAEAYMKSYVVYMLYGWVETWIQRGMKENADDIALLFSKV